MTAVQRRALRPLWRNSDLTILPADEDNTIVLLNTVDNDPACSKCAKDATDTVERKISLLLRTSALAEEVCERLRTAGTIVRFYGLTNNTGGLRHTLRNTGFPAYKQFKYLDGLLSPLFVRSTRHL